MTAKEKAEDIYQRMIQILTKSKYGMFDPYARDRIIPLLISQLDLQVGTPERDFVEVRLKENWNSAISSCIDICERNSTGILNLINEERNIISDETEERMMSDAELSRAIAKRLETLKLE
ncbi:MAG: hypothetical protein JETCAE03_35300 [Ignavibacteriaceae bacterium]|nr:MAG: hypothetical protein JETCAE03_35300 [Ignavibacteriaceae bacterium]